MANRPLQCNSLKLYWFWFCCYLQKLSVYSFCHYPIFTLYLEISYRILNCFILNFFQTFLFQINRIGSSFTFRRITLGAPESPSRPSSHRILATRGLSSTSSSMYSWPSSSISSEVSLDLFGLWRPLPSPSLCFSIPKIPKWEDFGTAAETRSEQLWRF